MKFLRILKRLLLALGVLLIVGAVLGVGAVGMVFFWASRDLPDIRRIADFSPPQVTTVLARDGSLLGSLYHEKRYMVSLSEMSRFIPLSFLAAEDDGFYRHGGVDPVAIIRAAINNFQRGGTGQGGSTITQQIIKQLLLSPEKSYERKIKEAILAYRLEKNLSKDEILTIYLNQIFLGQHAYGVEAAARTYFGKHATDITLAESALLAGMPQAPSRYNPFRNPQAAKNRQMYVLQRLLALQWISQEEYNQAAAEPLVYWTMPEGESRSAAWYMEETRRRLLDYFNESRLRQLGIKTPKSGEDFVYEAGLTVRTAMDPEHQAAAENALRQGLLELDKRQGWRGAEALSPQQQKEFLQKSSFTPLDLAGGSWVRALVSTVTKSGATLALGNKYKGFIAATTLGWARSPNPQLSGFTPPASRDPRTVLKPGDLVWVSIALEKDQELDTEKLRPETPIPLLLQQKPLVQGALVSIEPESGDVVALVGGYQFGDDHFNRATQAQRQPGSTFKAIVYSAGIDNGFTASSTVMDTPFSHVNPYTGKVWTPGNSDGQFHGPLPLYRALALSRNVCSVRVAQRIGIGKVIERAKDLGLEPDFPRELAVSLGAVAVSPLNMAQAYTAFANNGMVCTPRIITSITDAQGRELFRQDPACRQAISPQNAFIMASLLKRVITEGTGRRANVLDRPLAGKTGTTNEQRDAWFVGFTPHLVSSVYVGYDQVRNLGRGEQGGRTALPIFVYYRQAIEDRYPSDDFPQPDNIIIESNGLPYKADVPREGFYTEEGTPAAPAPEVQQGEDLLRQLF